MNIINEVAFLRTTREFPEDLHLLALETARCYIDIANSVNNRTIGLFPTTRPAITGNSYFLSKNQRNQSFRQVYTFESIPTGTTLSIPYKTQGFTQFVAIYGTCLTDFPDARPIPYAAATITNVITLRVDTANLNIIIANGSTAPNILSGLIVIEWISNP